MLPSYYEQVSSPHISVEANESATRPRPYHKDLLPFAALGGRRFEILSYLYLLDSLPADNSIVTLVKASGDKGRDVVVHRDGVLRRVIQCKALEEAFSRPALLRELVKFALFDRLEHFLSNAEFEYSIWAPGGLTGPASSLVAEWPNSLNEQEVREAFNGVTTSYKTLAGLNWEDCREDLLLHFPLSVKLDSKDGPSLSHSVSQCKPLMQQFFDVSIVFEKDDLAAVLHDLGVRPTYDADILRVLKDLEAIPQDKRVFLGMNSFGLSVENFALMNKEEIKDLMQAALAPFAALHRVLLSSIGRKLHERIIKMRDTLPHGSASFPMLLAQIFNARIVSRLHRNFTPKILQKPGELTDDIKPFRECAESWLSRLWGDLELARAGWKPESDSVGSDPEYRARIAEHAVLGYSSREQFESQLRRDINSNSGTIEAMDRELLALVPQRVLFISDTQLPFDNPDLLKLTVENFRKIERDEPNTLGSGGAAEGTSSAPPRPVLSEVTWSPVAYRSGALFRGYHHALVLRGENFSFGLQCAFRREGEGFPTGNSDYFWRSPNLLVPNQAEISAPGDDLEGPLSWRGYEFCVRNSPEQVSEWIRFSYPFDDVSLQAELKNCEEGGMALRNDGKFDDAKPLLRRAMVFADRIYGQHDPRTKSLWKLHEANLDDLNKSRLRFKVGDKVTLSRGDNSGRQGTVRSIALRHVQAYEIELEGGALVHAADKDLGLA